jgi:hypothetical protein
MWAFVLIRTESTIRGLAKLKGDSILCFREHFVVKFCGATTIPIDTLKIDRVSHITAACYKRGRGRSASYFIKPILLIEALLFVFLIVLARGTARYGRDRYF